MATLSITIPDAQATRIINSFAAANNYMATLPDGTPNPQTKAQFLKATVINYIRENVKAHESQVAAETARIAAQQTADNEVQLT